MVCIVTEKRGSTWVVRVHGQLGQDDVAVFDEACGCASGPLCLDLAELRGLDERGVEAIRAVVANGARLSGASPYVELRLGTEPKRRRKWR
jgi:hypothetical protein